MRDSRCLSQISLKSFDVATLCIVACFHYTQLCSQFIIFISCLLELLVGVCNDGDKTLLIIFSIVFVRLKFR
jgi:hypothetical membrane protein